MKAHFQSCAAPVLWACFACSDGETASRVREAAFPEQRPALSAPGHALAYIANRLSDTLSVVDLDEFRVLGTVPVGRDPVDIDGPRHLIPDPEHGLAYVALSYPESNLGPHATSLGSNGRLGYVLTLSLTTLAPLAEQRVDVSPGDIALSDARTELAVSHYDTLKALSLDPDIETRRAKLTLIEPAFDMNKGSAALRSYQVCAVPAAVAFGSRGDRVFIACTGEDSLVVVDTISGGVLSRVPTGSAIANKPYAMVRNPQGNRLLVSNQVSRSVLLFSAEDTPELLSETKFESFPLFSDFIDDTTYVVPLQDPDAVSMVNTVAGTVFSKQLPSECGCDSPAMLRYLPDGRLFLLCEGDHYVPGTLVRLDLQTLGCIEHLELGLYPERMELVIP